MQTHAQKTAQEPCGMKDTSGHPGGPGVGRLVYQQMSSKPPSVLALLSNYNMVNHQSAMQKSHDQGREQMDQTTEVVLLLSL